MLCIMGYGVCVCVCVCVLLLDAVGVICSKQHVGPAAVRAACVKIRVCVLCVCV